MAYDRARFEDVLRSDFDERLPSMREDRYWSDQLHDIADSAVPIMHRDRVELWLDLGLPDVDDAGLIDTSRGVDVMLVIAVAIYEHGIAYLYDLARDADLQD